MFIFQYKSFTFIKRLSIILGLWPLIPDFYCRFIQCFIVFELIIPRTIIQRVGQTMLHIYTVSPSQVPKVILFDLVFHYPLLQASLKYLFNVFTLKQRKRLYGEVHGCQDDYSDCKNVSTKQQFRYAFNRMIFVVFFINLIWLLCIKLTFLYFEYVYINTFRDIEIRERRRKAEDRIVMSRSRRFGLQMSNERLIEAMMGPEGFGPVEITDFMNFTNGVKIFIAYNVINSISDILLYIVIMFANLNIKNLRFKNIKIMNNYRNVHYVPSDEFLKKCRSSAKQYYRMKRYVAYIQSTYGGYIFFNLFCSLWYMYGITYQIWHELKQTELNIVFLIFETMVSVGIISNIPIIFIVCQNLINECERLSLDTYSTLCFKLHSKSRKNYLLLMKINKPIYLYLMAIYQISLNTLLTAFRIILSHITVLQTLAYSRMTQRDKVEFFTGPE